MAGTGIAGITQILKTDDVHQDAQVLAGDVSFDCPASLDGASSWRVTIAVHQHIRQPPERSDQRSHGWRDRNSRRGSIVVSSGDVFAAVNAS